VAVGFCLEMLESTTLREVWCETLDDITLVFDDAEGRCVEFVQAKASEMDQLWSISKLCEKEKRGANSRGLSIIEKSLMQDRCTERCRFRLVTARPVMDVLKILTFHRDTPAWKNGVDRIKDIDKDIEPRVGTFRSANGNDFRFWVQNAFWDVRHAEQAVHDSNLLKLGKLLSAQGLLLAPDQLEELYSKLLKKVWDASRIDPNVSPAEKRFLRDSLDTAIISMGKQIIFPLGTAKKLREKMQYAQLPEDVCETAVDLTRHYRREHLKPKYLSCDSQRLIEAEVNAILQTLKCRLDNGIIADDGIGFHSLCLEELESLRHRLPVTPTPSWRSCRVACTASRVDVSIGFGGSQHEVSSKPCKTPGWNSGPCR